MHFSFPIKIIWHQSSSVKSVNGMQEIAFPSCSAQEVSHLVLVVFRREVSVRTNVCGTVQEIMQDQKKKILHITSSQLN